MGVSGNGCSAFGGCLPYASAMYRFQARTIGSRIPRTNGRTSVICATSPMVMFSESISP